MGMLMQELRKHPSGHGSPIPDLELKNFCTPNAHRSNYPCMAHCKAAEIRGMVPAVLAALRKFADDTPISKHQVVMLDGLAKMYDTIHSAGMALTDGECDKLQGFLRPCVALVEKPLNTLWCPARPN